MREPIKPSLERIAKTLVEEIPLDIAKIYKEYPVPQERALALKIWKQHMDNVLANITEIKDPELREELMQRHDVLTRFTSEG